MMQSIMSLNISELNAPPDLNSENLLRYVSVTMFIRQTYPLSSLYT